METISDTVSGDISDSSLRLHDAVSENDLALISKLVKEAESLLFFKDMDGNLPIHTVCLQGDYDAVAKLEQLLLTSEGGSTTNNYALSENRKTLLSATNNDGHTALHLASRNRIPKLIKFLLNLGADAFAKDFKGFMPIHYACLGNSKNAMDSVAVIIKYSGYVDISLLKTVCGKTPMEIALSKGCTKMVKFLQSVNLVKCAPFI